MIRLGFIFLFIFQVILNSCSTEKPTPNVQVEGVYGQQTYCFTGPYLSESSEVNPFLDVRLSLTLGGPEGKRVIPGFFAADGIAAESGARAGNQWCVHARGFAPGTYAGKIAFEQGAGLALENNATIGEPLAGHGQTIVFQVTKAVDVDGWLHYNGSPYPRFSESGKIYLKSGTNSPENLLAFADIDGTYAYDTAKQFIKTYEKHVADWKIGDPTWQNGKGKGLIGALNYLASEGINGVYFVTNNIGGDARDVWPFVSHDTLDRYDVSKLAQWDIIFKHAEKLGIALQFVMQETENETLLDNGSTGVNRSLYYRELVARFGYHNSMVWNLGEENGETPWADDPFQTDEQRNDMAAWFAANDPYDHPVVIHTLPNPELKPSILNPLLGNKDLDGISHQTFKKAVVHDDMVFWRNRSDSSGHAWMMAMDEIGPWHTGSQADAKDPSHDTLRQEVLWGSFMAGAYGVEWYFGWHGDQNDLNAEDFRSRQNLWRQTKHCIDFFQEFELHLDDMRPADHLVGSNAWCLAKPNLYYLVYLPKGGETTLDLSAEGSRLFGILWNNPISGERQRATTNVIGGGTVVLKAPSAEHDWVATVVN